MSAKLANNVMNESFVAASAEGYAGKYASQIGLLESSLLRKVRPISEYDIYSLGRQLQAFEEMMGILEADGSSADLGTIPTIAYDALAVSFGSSPVVHLASIQPVDEEKGLVYFENVKALDDRGNMTGATTPGGDSFYDSRGGLNKSPSGYASERSTVAALYTTAAAAESYTGATLPAASLPVRPQTVVVSIAGLTDAIDNGSGVILGREFTGTIDYTTGAVDIDFAEGQYPGDGSDIAIQYGQSMELMTRLPRVSADYESKLVQAEVYALEGVMTLLKNFGMRKRFGASLDDIIARKLVEVLNAEITRLVLITIANNSNGNTTYDKNPQTGVSLVEHKQSWKDAMQRAEQNIIINAGRGTITALVAGTDASSVVSTLPGFTKLFDGNGIGAHVYGMLDGVVIIRSYEAGIVAADEAFPIFRGSDPFNAPVVVAPFMPITMTNIAHQQNILQTSRAIATWTAVDTLVPNFITKITLANN